MAGRTRTSVILAICFAIGTLVPVAAAQDRPLVIIVVDFQRIVRESAAAATVRQQIDELRNAYQGEFTRIEEELRAVEAELAEQRQVLPDEEFLRLGRDFEQRVTEAQRQAQYRRAALDRALDEAMNQIQSSLLDVIANLAEREGANVVLSRSNVVMVDQELDFTEEALAELDSVLPHVDVSVPEQQ